MKKIIGIGIALYLLSGCSSSSSGTMTCTTTSKQEQMTSSVTMNFKYEDDIVISQESETQIVAMTSDVYKQVESVVNASSNVFKGMNGASYEFESDEAEKMIKEKITIDFTKIAKEDKQKIVSYEDDEMNVDGIKQALTAQSYSCH